jgi:type 1 fimbria pilin
MRNSLCFLTGLIGWSLCSFAYADEGTITTYGSVVEDTCSIDTPSLDQTVIMETFSVGHVLRTGTGPSQPFTIRLVNCERDILSKYRVTFNGAADGNNFDLTGQAEGVALEISDLQGNVARPGIALPEQLPVGDASELEYNLRVIGNTHTLRAGDYRALIRFSLDYF